jgi:hypothetical protein
MARQTLGSHERDEGVVRGAVLIVLVGALLGLTYNFWGLMSNPAYGIAWIGEQRSSDPDLATG